MKIFGHIRPPYPINGFVTPILFVEEKNIGFYDQERHEMVFIDRQVHLVEEKEKKYYGGDGSDLYCYIRENGIAKYGTPTELFNYMVDLLFFDQKINNYAKIAVANFLQFPGKKIKLIYQINSNNKSKGLNFFMAPIRIDSLETILPETKYQIEEIIDTYIELKEKLPFLYWSDLVYFEQDHIILRNKKTSISLFQNVIVDYAEIFEDFFSDLDNNVQKNILHNNNSLYDLIISGEIQTPFPFKETTKDKFTFHVVYNSERRFGEKIALNIEKDEIDEIENKKENLKINLKKLRDNYKEMV